MTSISVITLDSHPCCLQCFCIWLYWQYLQISKCCFHNVIVFCLFEHLSLSCGILALLAAKFPPSGDHTQFAYKTAYYCWRFRFQYFTCCENIIDIHHLRFGNETSQPCYSEKNKMLNIIKVRHWPQWLSGSASPFPIKTSVCYPTWATMKPNHC